MGSYVLVAILNSAVPFLLLPTYTKHLTPEDLGLLALVGTYTTLLAPFIILGVPTLFLTEYHRLNLTDFNRKSLIWVTIPLILGGVFSFLFWALNDLLERLIKIPCDWTWVIPSLVFLSVIPQCVNNMLRITNQLKQFVLYQTLGIVLMLLTIFISIAILGLGWEGKLLSMLLVSIVLTIVGFKMLLPFLSISTPNIKDFSELLKFGFGLLPYSLLSQSIRQGDRLLVAYIIGLSAAGEYVVGWQVASLMLIVITIFNQAWTPYFYKQIAQSDYYGKLVLVKTSYFLAFVMCIIFFAIIISSPLIFNIFIPNSYQNSIEFVPFIALGYLLIGFQMFFLNYIYYLKKTYLLSIVMIFGGILNLGLGYIFLKIFGVIGITYTFAITNACTLIFIWVLAQKIHPMPWFSPKNFGDRNFD